MPTLSAYKPHVFTKFRCTFTTASNVRRSIDYGLFVRASDFTAPVSIRSIDRADLVKLGKRRRRTKWRSSSRCSALDAQMWLIPNPSGNSRSQPERQTVTEPRQSTRRTSD